MASIVLGYEYDFCLRQDYRRHVFISYRQKDNKGDRWVSEFVDVPGTKANQPDHYCPVRLHLAHKN